MKTEINGKWYNTATLQFVAHYENMEDRSNFFYFQEILFKAFDGNFILHCSGNGGSPHGKLHGDTKVKSTFLKFEPAPDQWLLTHGHLRLAGFMKPEMRRQIEMKLHSWGMKSDNDLGEVFYHKGEVKGEVNPGD